jgi:hypothetical protein
MTSLELLTQADWKYLQLKMLEYTMFKIGRLHWRTPRGALPKGMTAEDVVIGAIQKTFEGARPSTSNAASAPGIRKWNPETCPELLDFLKSVIDSDVSHLVASEEHRLTRYSETGEPEDWTDHRMSPEEALLSREAEKESERAEGFIESLFDEFKDDPEVCLVLTSYRQQALRDVTIKPANVAAETGLEIETVRNAIKRLRRKILQSRIDRSASPQRPEAPRRARGTGTERSTPP